MCLDMTPRVPPRENTLRNGTLRAPCGTERGLSQAAAPTDAKEPWTSAKAIVPGHAAGNVLWAGSSDAAWSISMLQAMTC